MDLLKWSQGQYWRLLSTLIVILCITFLGFKTDPNPKHLYCPSLLYPYPTEHKAWLPWDQSTSLPGGQKTGNAGDTLTPRFQLTLYPASRNHLGSCIHLPWALVFPPVKQVHLAQGVAPKPKVRRGAQGTGTGSTPAVCWHLADTWAHSSSGPPYCRGTLSVSQITAADVQRKPRSGWFQHSWAWPYSLSDG